mmetsp:Transcript_3164/g.12713  ORF Transcript_3164/g.12713 Transcript_3164/m.12713 type:complete len:252 (+) Transcript_3164:1609-2364(+)
MLTAPQRVGVGGGGGRVVLGRAAMAAADCLVDLTLRRRPPVQEQAERPASFRVLVNERLHGNLPQAPRVEHLSRVLRALPVAELFHFLKARAETERRVHASRPVAFSRAAFTPRDARGERGARPPALRDGARRRRVQKRACRLERKHGTGIETPSADERIVDVVVVVVRVRVAFPFESASDVVFAARHAPVRRSAHVFFLTLQRSFHDAQVIERDVLIPHAVAERRRCRQNVEIQSAASRSVGGGVRSGGL